MEEKVMIIEFVFVQDTQRQPGEVRLQAFGAHETGQLDVIKAVIVRQVWR
jgi:hypothetical protein